MRFRVYRHAPVPRLQLSSLPQTSSRRSSRSSRKSSVGVSVQLRGLDGALHKKKQQEKFEREVRLAQIFVQKAENMQRHAGELQRHSKETAGEAEANK